MAKKLLLVSLLLVLVIASVDLVVDVSAQAGEVLQDAAGKATDAAKTAETTSVSWADWAKNKFKGLTGGGSTNDDGIISGSPATAPTPMGI